MIGSLEITLGVSRDSLLNSVFFCSRGFLSVKTTKTMHQATLSHPCVGRMFGAADDWKMIDASC